MTNNDPISRVAGGPGYSVSPSAPPPGTSGAAATGEQDLPGPPRMPQLTLEEMDPSRVRGFSPERALAEQMGDLERWVQANLRAERGVTLRFWALRVPALLCAVVALATSSLQLSTLFVTLAAAVALLVAIDSVWPGGSRQGPLRKALYELRRLQNTIKLRWDRVRLAHPDPTSPRRVAYVLALLDMVQSKRENINRYLIGLVAGPGVGEQTE